VYIMSGPKLFPSPRCLFLGGKKFFWPEGEAP
jgi:hypothetical protein